MSHPPLNPDALEAGAKALFLRERKHHTPSIECPEPPNWEDLTATSMEHYRGNARAVLAAAQPVVNSVEEIEALPYGSFIVGDSGVAVLKFDGPNYDWVTGSDARYRMEEQENDLPARVLYRPSEGGHDGR